MAPPANMYQPGTVLTVGSHQAVVTRYFSEGGFAHVYQVQINPPENGTSVACLKRVAVPDKQSLNNLRAEVDSMKRLCGNRHIVSYIDSHAARMTDGSSDYEVFVLMEFCANKGLIDFMNTRLQNRLTEPEVLRIMGEVTEGVCNMHALTPPLVHRDIKIENVLISGTGDYKLCDFGSASMVLRPPRNAEEFAILQNDVMKNTTPQYRSPEMLDLYKGLPINEKSDIWALGVFLYKLCYFTTPFEHKGEPAILSGQFEFPSRPVYSDRLKHLISVLLRVDPRRRPNSYQVLEEVCNMRGIPVPVEDYTKTFKPPAQHPSSSTTISFKQEPLASQSLSLPPKQPTTSFQPQPPSRIPPTKTKVPIQNVPISKAKYGYGLPSDSSADLNALNNSAKSIHSFNSSIPAMKPDPFKGLVPVKSSVTERQPSEKMYKNNGSLSKSMGSLSINPNSSLNRPIVPHKPKYVDSVVQTDEEPIPRAPARPSKKVRPTSMYVPKTQPPSSLDTKQSVTEHGTGSELKRIISGLSNHTGNDYSPKGENHIDSNIEFLKNLEQQDSGKSWISQHTGGSFKSLRRISSGTKKAGSLITSFTGRFSRPSSRSSSRTPSINQGLNSTQTGSSIKFRSSSESISEEEPYRELPVISSTGSDSIQKRVQKLMNRSNDPPIIKTAKGYGNDAFQGLSTSSSRDRQGSVDSDGFIKPALVKKPLKQANPSTPPLSSHSTPSTVTKTPKSQNTSSSGSPQSTIKKKLPPAKPKKPEHLRTAETTPKLKSSGNYKSKPVDHMKFQDTASQYLSVSNEDGLVRVQSLDSSTDDSDDWERKFNEKYPRAL